MADIAVRWAGPADAGASSSYRIERTLDNSVWTTLAASQAATSPYVSPLSTIAGDTGYGVDTVSLADASSFSTSGFGWLDDALLEWTGKSGNDLTGVTWHSGYGTYASGTTMHEAHESYADSGASITNSAALYRVTHIDGDGVESAPAYLWYYSPPPPQSSEHCVVIVGIGADLGVAVQESVSVTCQLATDDQFSLIGGQHLDANADPATANTQTTNALGLAFFHCWKTGARWGGAAAPYKFLLKPGAGELAVTASTIPDRDWVLLAQIAD